MLLQPCLFSCTSRGHGGSHYFSALAKQDGINNAGMCKFQEQAWSTEKHELSLKLIRFLLSVEASIFVMSTMAYYTQQQYVPHKIDIYFVRQSVSKCGRSDCMACDLPHEWNLRVEGGRVVASYGWDQVLMQLADPELFLSCSETGYPYLEQQTAYLSHCLW